MYDTLCDVTYKMKYKDRPFYRKKYRNELIQELIDPVRLETAKHYMRRTGMSLKDYLIKIWND